MRRQSHLILCYINNLIIFTIIQMCLIETLIKMQKTLSSYTTHELIVAEFSLAKRIIGIAKQAKIMVNLDERIRNTIYIICWLIDEKCIKNQEYVFPRMKLAYMVLIREYGSPSSKNPIIKGQMQGSKITNQNQGLETKKQYLQNITLSKQKMVYVQQRVQSSFIYAEKFLEQQSYFLNHKLIDVSNGQIYLSDPNCLGCSQIFYQGEQMKKFHNQDQISGLTSKQIFDRDLLEKTICGMANKSEGIIISGVMKQNRSIITGHYLTEAQNINLTNMLNMIKGNIYPLIQIQIDFLPVINNINYIYSDPNDEINRFCVRIIVLPLQQRKLHYLKIENKGYDPTFQCYNFGEKQPSVIHPTDIYNQIIGKFNSKEGNLLKSFQHKKPIFTPTFSSFSSQQNLSENNGNGIYEDEKLKLLQPSFIYSNTSLLIVGSEKKTIFIQKFTESLKKDKKIFDLQKPFSSISKNCGRKIFFLSHDDKADIIKDLLNKYDKGKNIKLIPLQKCMRIPVNKMTEDQLQLFKSQYRKVYHDIPFQNSKKTAATGSGEDEECHFFEFDTRSSSVFAYILFQSIGVKPFVLKYIPKGNQKNNFVQNNYT